ncbi:MAG: hypothetical protein KBT20_01150 [Bacteroidales bacterium]|nr:hypothetical protein [Candidatus Liminaster caballi]
MEQLREQVGLLKERCVAAEKKVALLEQKSQSDEAKIVQLEQQNKDITEKYQNLMAGAATATSPEEIERLRNRYLAMIREIDDCIEKLNGR